MVQAGALEWSDALDKLVEYAELDAVGKPAGRMPLLLRVADHFGIDRGVAKDVCKTLVLRVLNGGQVAAWCRDMGIDLPEGEPQRDLEDLVEVARIVRQAFFKMMERDNPGSPEALRTRTWAYMLDKHARQVQDALRKGETPPQKPSFAKRDRTMFSHCIFDLEDTVLDCVDTKLRELGWGVDSLIYDGVSRNALHRSPPSTDLLTPTDSPLIRRVGGVHAVARSASRRSQCRRPGGSAARRGGRRQREVGLHDRTDREAALRLQQCHPGRDHGSHRQRCTHCNG